MLKKNADPNWGYPTETQRLSFEKLEVVLVNPPILRLPECGSPYMIYTDENQYVLGAVLLPKSADGCGRGEKLGMGHDRVLVKDANSGRT